MKNSTSEYITPREDFIKFPNLLSIFFTFWSSLAAESQQLHSYSFVSVFGALIILVVLLSQTGMFLSVLETGSYLSGGSLNQQVL